LAQYLLEIGAAPYSKNKKRTPIFDACEKGYAKVCELLIRNGLGPGELNKMCGMNYPIHIACEKAHSKVVDLLVKNGVDIEAKTQQFQTTPLYIAACARDFESFKILIENGADYDGVASRHQSKNHTVWDILNPMTTNPTEKKK